MLHLYRSLLISLLAVGLSCVALPDAAAQSTGTVTGRVVDAENGAPLPGANVVVEGTAVGTSTNEDGEYELRQVPAGEQTLVVSFVSYQDEERTLQISGNQTTTVNVRLSSGAVEADEVVVTGIRESQMRSVMQKKQSINIVDALSADDIGNLPEKNVAEAIQRLPGIVLQNDRTEGRFVSIRGGASNRNSVTLNGNTMASTADTRATALDLLPAEMVSNVEVTKAVTPDMPGNAVGGSINISTLSAFDRQGSFAFGSLRGLNHDQQVGSLRDLQGKDVPFRANLTGGTKFGSEDQFGVLFSVSGSRRDFTTSGLKGESWAFEANPDDQGLDTDNIPEAQEQIVEFNKRNRIALNTSVDWRPGEQTSVYVRPYYTYTDEEKLDNELEYNLGQYGFSEEPEFTDNGARFPAGFGSLDLSLTDEEERLWGTSVGGEHNFGSGVTLSASGTFSRGVLEAAGPDAEFETPITTQASGVADMTNFLFDFFPENPGYVGDGANYMANEVDMEFEENTEDTYSAKTDIRIPFEVSDVPGYLKTGGQLTVRDKEVDQADIGYNYPDFDDGGGPLTLDDYRAPRVQTQQVGNSLLPFADTEQFRNDFLSNICNPDLSTPFSSDSDRSCRNNTLFEINEAGARQNDIEDDSQNEEEIYAGYAMASVDVGALTALVGARVEHTSTFSRRFTLVEERDGEEIGDETFEKAYTDLLPSVHLTYEVNDDLQLRGAWSNTIGRPDYDELSSFSEVEINDQGNETTASVEEGNPNLEPFRAMNFDLGAEYYFENGGLASVAGFYKHIDNPIFRFETEEQNVENPFGDGRTFDRVSRTQDRNADAGEILGVEATYQQPFTFLPEPFDGVGINSNVTVTDSEVDVPSRPNADLPFFEQADLVYNIAPYYQAGGFEGRVAINYRDDYLVNIDDDGPLEDTFVDDRTTVDINARYEFADLLGQPTVMFQVENATNEPEVEYEGRENALGFHFLSGRTFTLGLSAQF